MVTAAAMLEGVERPNHSLQFVWWRVEEASEQLRWRTQGVKDGKCYSIFIISISYTSVEYGAMPYAAQPSTP
jgi:hypothetical protein